MGKPNEINTCKASLQEAVNPDKLPFTIVNPSKLVQVYRLQKACKIIFYVRHLITLAYSLN